MDIIIDMGELAAFMDCEMPPYRGGTGILIARMSVGDHSVWWRLCCIPNGENSHPMNGETPGGGWGENPGRKSIERAHPIPTSHG